MDLVHRFDDHTDVVRFGHCLQRWAGRSGVTSEHGAGTGTVDVVGGVADGTDTRQVGGSATTKDRLLDVLPESGLVKKL